MLIKSLKAWHKESCLGLVFALLSLLLLSGCSTVCLEPEELCASKGANTSLHPRVIERSALPAPAPAPEPASAPVPRPDPTDAVRTAPITLPGQEAPPANTVRVALLLPMNSASLAGAAESVRAGFMAGATRDGAGFQVDLVATGDDVGQTLAAYDTAAATHDLVVGPLDRPAVSALAARGSVPKSTIALNHPETRGALPRGMWVAGLSIEDEAKQVAEWAAREHPNGRALILTGSPAWAQRAADAFDARWSELGHTGQRVALPSANGRVDPALLEELKNRLEIDPPALLFAALDVAELRQVRTLAGTTLPVYGGATINPGRAPGLTVPELDGIHVVDVPWLVLPDHPAVMVYPRLADPELPLYMHRLYALGIDAFLVARELALRPGAPFRIDGVSGRLTLDADGRLRRREAQAVYRDGGFTPADTGP